MDNAKDKNSPSTVTRRRFISGAGMAAMAGVIAGAHILPKEVRAAGKPSSWAMETDVVIVGGGGGGLAAAVEAANRGSRVILVEKTRLLGGSSIICGGALAFAGTDLQASENVKDSNELFYKDLLTVGKNVNDINQVKAYVDNQLDTYYWLKKAGVKFYSLGIVSGMSVPRSHKSKPHEIIKILSDLAKKNGVNIITGCAAKRLVIDCNTGKVCGIVADKKGKEISIGAAKGVILTSGGFARNKDLLEKFVPPMAQSKAITGLGNYGDGLKMAWAAGADIKDMPYIKATFGQHPTSPGQSDRMHIYYQGAIIVNKAGKRYVKESISYKLLGDEVFKQPGSVGFAIYDKAIRDAEMDKGMARVEKIEKKGLVYQADTIEELAQKAGLPVAALKETITRYNQDIKSGEDTQFGRDTLVAGYGKPVAIMNPPYFAYPCTGAVLGTYGGILIDKDARVLDVFGSPIEGLYAAGEIVGGLHGAAYMTGTAFGKALVFGRIAAKNISGKKAA